MGLDAFTGLSVKVVAVETVVKIYIGAALAEAVLKVHGVAVGTSSWDAGFSVTLAVVTLGVAWSAGDGAVSISVLVVDGCSLGWSAVSLLVLCNNYTS